MGLTVKELRAKIAEVEKMIAKAKGKNMSFEKTLVKSWKTYLPGGRNHHKLSSNALE
ncbi:unnamed protein product [marine sediment metagenome]|uniref:Uncharacterized protein n=1 Tax=marine sediment metagenome TaxID=412755 RepID=X1C6C0_9ZZZZ